MVDIEQQCNKLLVLLSQAQEDTCSLHCPSVWKTGELQPHSEKCVAISRAITEAKTALQEQELFRCAECEKEFATSDGGLFLVNEQNGSNSWLCPTHAKAHWSEVSNAIADEYFNQDMAAGC